MPRIDIRTTLSCGCPRTKKHEVIVVTRGATAMLDFDLTMKVYTIDNMDQFTVLLKQDNNTYGYNAFRYFTPTNDAVAILDKIYYTKIEPNDPGKHNRDYPEAKFIKANVAMGGSVVGLYEEWDLPDDTDPQDNWALDDHFALTSDYKMITFTLNSDETSKFRKSCGEDYVLVETATKLNTDWMREMHKKDSVIIDRWHYLEIADSIYCDKVIKKL